MTRRRIDRIAEALLPYTLGSPQYRQVLAYKMARASVRAYQTPGGRRPYLDERFAPKPARSLAERIKNPVTEADWELYFDNQRKEKDSMSGLEGS